MEGKGGGKKGNEGRETTAQRRGTEQGNWGFEDVGAHWGGEHGKEGDVNWGIS